MIEKNEIYLIALVIMTRKPSKRGVHVSKTISDITLRYVRNDNDVKLTINPSITYSIILILVFVLHRFTLL